MITAKERIEKIRDKFLILSEDTDIKAVDRLKALSIAYEIEKELNTDKF